MTNSFTIENIINEKIERNSSVSQSDVTTLQTDVTALQSDVTTLQTDVTASQSDVTALQTDVTASQSDVTALQTDVTTLQTDVTALQNTSSSSYNPILFMRKNTAQNINNHNETTIIWDQIIFQSSDLKITHSNGVFTLVDPGVYELTSDIFWTGDDDVGIKKVFFKHSESQLKQYATQTSFNDLNNINQNVRYTTTGYVYATVPNSTIQVRVYQSNADSDTLQFYSNNGQYETRCCIRRVA
jgi:polyhydroxyalkanoate synthesis regulator phasin